jgi:outer membrane protein TolC
MLLLLLPAILVSGCMSSDSHREKADTTATGVIAEYQQKALGRTEPFTIEERAAESLRRRLMIAQDLPGHVSGVSSNAPLASDQALKIALLDAMQIAARNNRSYQAEKEKVFTTALDLDLTRSEYRNSYSGLLSSMFSGSGSGDNADRSAKGDVDAGITRKLQSGATLSAKLGLDLAKLLTMDKQSTFGILADATVTIPLLKGFGRDIAREPLTQAERGMVYAMWSFERFKKTFAIEVAASYLKTLELEKQIQNAEANYRSIVATRERVEALGTAGRTSQTEVDQASQNELQANNGLVSARQGLEAQLDTFKTKLGIPVDAGIELDALELVRLSQETMDRLSEEPEISGADAAKQMSTYVLNALSNRLDLVTVRHQYEDARRKLKVAEDALDADMQLVISGSTRRTDVSGSSVTVGDSTTTTTEDTDTDENGSDTGTRSTEVSFSDGASYSALLKLDLPWDKTAERAAFRKGLISLRSAERAVEEKEDSVKQELRSAARRIIELKKTYLIQREAVALAERRVESTDLFLQAGEAQVRDLLEAQEDLVEARDGLVSAVVDYHVATLNLKKDLELLEVNEKGLWQDND